MNITTERLAPNSAGIARAAAILRAGGRVAFPTETVYGLGADARSDRAVSGIYAAKDRPTFNPLIVHVPDLQAGSELGDLSDAARALAAKFWPGPLTLVVPARLRCGVSTLATAGLETIALRVPGAPLARKLLAAAGIPIAAPSANPSGRISPTTAEHVFEGLGGRIEAVLDGGACAVGVELTILDLSGTGAGPRLLRPGGVPVEALEAALGHPVIAQTEPVDAPAAPGMLASHYAPRARLRLNATRASSDEVLLGFGPMAGAAETLSLTGDLVEATANLFAALHRLDATGARAIAVATIPETGLGRAINDRLRRAAAPRDPDGA